MKWNTAHKTLWNAILMVRQCDRRAFCTKFLTVVLSSLLPLANLVVLKVVIDKVTLHASAKLPMQQALPILGAYIGLFCFIFLLNRLILSIDGYNTDRLSQKLIDHISGLLQQQSVRLDMAYYDNPTYHDTFHRAQQEANYRPINIMNNAMDLVGSVISLVGVVALLYTASWLIIVVMIVAVVPSLLVRLRKARKIYDFRRDRTQDFRRTNYYASVLTQRSFAKEVKVFGLSAHFRQRYVELRSQLVDKILAISRRLLLMDSICSVIEVAALFGVLMVLTTKCYLGALTIGSFVMFFEAFRRGQGFLQRLISSVTGLYDSRLFMGNLFEFLELEPNITSPQEPLPFPQQVQSVEFRDVSFRYADMDRDVLHHYNFTARSGVVTRIEGENGFGKTTLLKLLLRLYDPSEGTILVNGIDIKCFAVKELRKGIGAIFQDYVHFFCSVDENIAFGDIDSVGQPDVRKRIEEAARLAGADQLIRKLPQGYQTQLGRMFSEGAELSMGQWQRIALARLIYAQSPVMVMDEPTAWMDASARSHFYTTLDQLKEQHLIIMISHI